MQGADLSFAFLQGASFSSSFVHSVRFCGSSLQGASFDAASLVDSLLAHDGMFRTIFEHSDINRASIIENCDASRYRMIIGWGGTTFGDPIRGAYDLPSDHGYEDFGGYIDTFPALPVFDRPAERDMNAYSAFLDRVKEVAANLPDETTTSAVQSFARLRPDFQTKEQDD